MPLVLKNPLCSWWERRADIHINHLARTQASFTISHTFLFLYFALLNKIKNCYIQATVTRESPLFGFCQTGHFKGSSGKQVPSSFFFSHMACITLCFTTMPKGFEAHLLIITFPSSSVPSFSCFQMLREKRIQTVDKMAGILIASHSREEHAPRGAAIRTRHTLYVFVKCSFQAHAASSTLCTSSKSDF